MKRPQKLRDECYNCYNLYGGPFNPKCFARKPCYNEKTKEICDSYKPIIKHNAKIAEENSSRIKNE